MIASTSTSTGSVATARDIECFRERGYVIFRGVFDGNEIERASAEADELLARTDLTHPHNLRAQYATRCDTNEPVFDMFDPVFDIAPVLRGMGQSERMLGTLASLFGERACQIKDKLIYRPPHANGYRIHQDWIAPPAIPPSYTASIIAIDRFDEQSGCTEVFPGAHTFGYLSPTDGEFHYLEVERLPSREAVPLLLDPGDVAVFGCFMPHRSAPNRSNRYRRGVFVSYNAVSHGGQQREAFYRWYDPWRSARRPDADKPFLFFR